VIRGAVYKVNLGEEKRGHEQRGRRYGLVISPSSMAWRVATIVPTSRSAQDAVFRPTLELMVAEVVKASVNISPFTAPETDPVNAGLAVP